MAALILRPSGLHASAWAEWNIADVVARAAKAWRTHRLYRKTRRQLHALSIREREDIGLAGADLDAVARDAVYRK